MNGIWSPPPNCFGIVGWKNSGKTTMTARLVAEFTERGFRVATIKHAHHAFAVDDGETDSAKHRRAGAAQVGVVSTGRWALITERDETATDPNDALKAMLGRLDPADIVLIEGFKSSPHCKLEVRRQSASRDAPLAERDPKIVAIAADHAITSETHAVFEIDDVTAIADFIIGHLKITSQRSTAAL